jgi:hypothetical protein
MKAEVELPRGLQTGIPLPQCGERLSNGTKGAFHCTSFDCSGGGSQRTHAVSLSEYLEEGDGICDGLQEGVAGEVATEFRPY